jgi:hypothetical protein
VRVRVRVTSLPSWQRIDLLASLRLCHGDTEAQYVDRSIQCEDENLRLKREGECERSRGLILDPANPRCTSKVQTGQTSHEISHDK